MFFFGMTELSWSSSRLELGYLLGKSAGLVIEGLPVRIPAGMAGEFSSPGSTLCADSLFGVCSTHLLMLWHVKDPSHSSKNADGKIHLNTHTPSSQRSRSGQTMLLSRHIVGTYPETSSHANCQGQFCHSCLSSLSQCGLILA